MNMHELDEIRQQYLKGEFDTFKVDLERFIIDKKEEIIQYKQEFNKKYPQAPITDEVAIKFFILQSKSINPEREIRDQLDEIQKEKWIHGVKFGRPPDPFEVAVNWAKLYSPGWRAHRVFTYVFIFDQEKDRYLKLLV